MALRSPFASPLRATTFRLSSFRAHGRGSSGQVNVAQTDDFNRAASNPLGVPWVDVAGSMGVEDNTAYFGTIFGSGELQRHRYDVATGSTSMRTQIDIVLFSVGGYSDARIMGRWDDTSYYELRVNNAGEWYVNRVVGAAETDVVSGVGLVFSLPETWALEITGTSPVHLSILRDEVEVGSFDDSDATRIQTGQKGGIGGFTAGGLPSDVRMDNYSQSVL